MSAKLISVIETDLLRLGDGKEDPIRRVTQYWSTDGVLLAQSDPLAYNGVASNGGEADEITRLREENQALAAEGLHFRLENNRLQAVVTGLIGQMPKIARAAKGNRPVRRIERALLAALYDGDVPPGVDELPRARCSILQVRRAR